MPCESSLFSAEMLLALLDPPRFQGPCSAARSCAPPPPRAGGPTSASSLGDAGPGIGPRAPTLLALRCKSWLAPFPPSRALLSAWKAASQVQTERSGARRLARPVGRELETRHSTARRREDHPAPTPPVPVRLLPQGPPHPLCRASTAHGLTCPPRGQRVRLHKAGDAPWRQCCPDTRRCGWGKVSRAGVRTPEEAGAAWRSAMWAGEARHAAPQRAPGAGSGPSPPGGPGPRDARGPARPWASVCASVP